jgi:DNA-directed RNA polymerase specialized sigma24 family protein
LDMETPSSDRPIAGSTSSRMTASLISQNLDDFWPEVEPRLLTDLRAHGVAPETARDICQEVAERALIHDVPCVDAGDLLRWARVVGRRIAIDHHRKQARLLVGDVPDRPIAHGPEEIIGSRLDVEAVVTAMASMSAADQSLILDAESGATRQDRTRIALRRHRARQRLRTIVGSALGWLAAPLLRRSAKSTLALVAMPILVTLLVLPTIARHHDARMPHRDRPTSTTSTTSTSTVRATRPVARTTIPQATPRSKLRPLQGRRVDIPTGTNSRVYTRERVDQEPLVCYYDLAIVGDVCTPL